MPNVKLRIFDKVKGCYLSPFSYGWRFADVMAGEYDDVVILERSTGKFDSKGKEIFEGDICEGHWTGGYRSRKQNKKSLWIIEWATDPFPEFRESPLKSFTSMRFRGIPLYEDLTIIGNVNQNPEMLKN